MMIRLGRQLTLGLLATCWCTGLCPKGTAAPSETSLTLTIHIRNYAEVDHETLMEAEKVATGVFRKAGVETRWINALSSGNGQKKFTGEEMSNPSHIQLNILPPLMAERLGLPDNVMGVAPGTCKERDRQVVYISYNKVETIAEWQAWARIEGSISTSALRVQILGHAIVHEIGHLLLNQESHSDTGIMRAIWDLKQLRDACYGYLVFTPSEAEAIRLDVTRRSKE